MNYTPIYALVLLAAVGAVLFFVVRAVSRWRLSRDERGRVAQQARNAERWERRNDLPRT